MEYYDKIDTLFKRGEDFGVIVGEYTRPEFQMLNRWHVTEKVDGTSTLIHFKQIGFEVGGRTARSNMSDEMTDVMWETANDALDKAWAVMDRFGLETMTVYGELYGPKIQNGGSYSDVIEFRAFDIRADDVFLSPDQFFASAHDIGIPTVPFLGDVATLDEIIEYVRGGFDSTFALRNKRAEGIIAKSPVELQNNAGKRLMFKLKERDFK